MYITVFTVWKNEKYSLTKKKIFRETNFFNKNVAIKKWFDGKNERFSNIVTLWKYEKFTAIQVFSSNQFFSKTLIWRKMCKKTVAVKYCDFQTVKITLSSSNFRDKNYWKGPRKILNCNLILKIKGPRISAVREGPRKILIALLNLEKKVLAWRFWSVNFFKIDIEKLLFYLRN